MKHLLFLAAALVLGASCLLAQAPASDLTFTLPTGKIVTFKTPEQKAQFLAARDRSHQAAPTTAVPQTAQPEHSLSSLGHTALDERPNGTGRVNVGAPTFTADYYLAAAETWVGKPITLSVAYVTLRNETPRADGMRQLLASTWGKSPGTGEQNPGGSMTILATPAAAQRLVTLCGSTLQFTQGVKMTLLHGELSVLNDVNTGTKEYGLVVTQ